MKLTFLKVSLEQTDSGFLISIAPGALRFNHKGADVALAEPLQLEMVADKQGHKFTNILRYIAFEVFEGEGLNSEIIQASVFAIVTHQDFEQALYKAMRQCKVVPMMRLVDERQLFASEYERLYELLIN